MCKALALNPGSKKCMTVLLLLFLSLAREGYIQLPKFSIQVLAGMCQYETETRCRVLCICTAYHNPTQGKGHPPHQRIHSFENLLPPLPSTNGINVTAVAFLHTSVHSFSSFTSTTADSSSQCFPHGKSLCGGLSC